jgi:hypothetical protein
VLTVISFEKKKKFNKRNIYFAVLQFTLDSKGLGVNFAGVEFFCIKRTLIANILFKDIVQPKKRGV